MAPTWAVPGLLFIMMDLQPTDDVECMQYKLEEDKTAHNSSS